MQVPIQANGYDCGVYVTKFVEMILKLRPTSTSADIHNSFKTQLPVNYFGQAEVDRERIEMRNWIEKYVVYILDLFYLLFSLILFLLMFG